MESGPVIQQIYKDLTTLATVVYGPELYSDSRDGVISMLNKLLAATGVGHGYYRKDVPPFQFTTNNYFYRFKGVGYNRLSRHKDKEGFVSLILKVKPSELETPQQKQKFIDDINNILRAPKSLAQPTAFGTQTGGFGSFGAVAPQQPQQQQQPNLYTEVKSIIPLGEEHTELVIFVTEQGRKTWTATQLYNDKIKCEKVVPKLEVSMDDVERYLKRPPNGFEEIWIDAVKNNPDPANLVPSPIYGFPQLIQRQKMQKTTIEHLQLALKDFNNRLENVEYEVVTAHNKYTMCKQVQKQLSHRLLRVLAAQMLLQRYNLPIDENEEQLQCRLEQISGQLNAPDRIKSRISVIYDFIRRNEQQIQKRFKEQQTKVSFTKEELLEIKRCLASRQSLLEGLVQTIKNSENTLNIINNISGK